MRICLVVAFCLLPIAAHGQAFGLKMGMQLSELDVIEKLEPVGYSYAIRPPEPSPYFDRYLVLVGEDAGLCVATGVRSFDTAGEARGLLNQLWGPLEGLYGPRQITEDYGYTYNHVPEPLMDVTLKTNSGRATLAYRFANYESCASEILSVDTTGL